MPTGEWVLVSSHRLKRPRQGQQEAPGADHRPAASAPATNSRAGSEANLAYTSVFVLDNDSGTPQADVPDGGQNQGGLLRAEINSGTCRAIPFWPRHDLALPQIAVPAIRRVVGFRAAEFQTLGTRPGIKQVQTFENKGPVLGCLNPHGRM